jgi:uncharacterized RDD family membrane protein YckC
MGSMMVAPLYALFLMAPVRAAETPAPAASEPAASASWADADEASEPSADTHDRANRHRHNGRNHHDGQDRGEQGGNQVNIGHDSTLLQGQKADAVVSIFGSSTSDGDAEDVISIFGDTRVTGEVSDSAVAVLGSTYIDGKVDGDAVAVLGDMELGPHAEIGGDVVAVGGGFRRDPAAVVHGTVQNIIGGDFGGMSWLHAWIRHCLLYGRPLAFAPGLGWAWGLAFAFLALYAALALLFREGLYRCVQTFEAQPGRTVLAALIAALLTPVLVVLLCVTVIGIAAVPFVVFGLFCVALFGKAVMLAWLGGRITGKHGVGQIGNPAVAVLVGGALVLALYVVPVLGFLVYKILGFLGLGAVVYTAILASRAHQAARAGSRGPGATPEPTPVTGVTPAPGADGSASAISTTSAASAASAASVSGAPQGQPQAQPQAPPQPQPQPQPQAPPQPPPQQSQPQAQAQAQPQAHSQHQPTAALPRAGFWIRMVALLLDALLVGFLMHVLHVYHLELVVLAAYGAVMWKLRGATIGGIVFDLHVVRMDGRPIDWETAIIRALSCFLSLAVAGLGFIWIAFDDNKQAWHDKIAGTVVVRVAKGVPLV